MFIVQTFFFVFIFFIIVVEEIFSFINPLMAKYDEVLFFEGAICKIWL